MISSPSNSYSAFFDAMADGSLFGILKAIVVFLLFCLPMAGAAVDLTAFQYALKELYTDQRLLLLFYKDRPWLAMVQKFKKMVGDYWVIPVRYAPPQGIAGHGNFTTAKTNRGTTQGIRFEVYRRGIYGFMEFDEETLEAAGDDAGAFIRAKQPEMDALIEQTSQDLALFLYGTGTGKRGRIASGSGTDTIVLENITDVVNFEKGMVLTAKTADTSGGAVKAGNVVVESVNRDTGEIVCVEAAWNDAAGIATIADGDYLYREGTYDDVITGLGGWIPETAPTVGDDFWNVDRSVDPTRLGGVRVDGTGLTKSEALQKMLRRQALNGGKSDLILAHNNQVEELNNELGPKTQYENIEAGAEAKIGFTAFKINGPKGAVRVVSDVVCPNETAFGVNLESFKLGSLGDLPKIYNRDGQTILRMADADSVEFRVHGYGNLGCDAPGHSARVELDAA